MNNMEQEGEEPEAEDWDAAEAEDTGEAAAYGLTLYCLDDDESDSWEDPRHITENEAMDRGLESDVDYGSDDGAEPQPSQLVQPGSVNEEQASSLYHGSRAVPMAKSPGTPAGSPSPSPDLYGGWPPNTPEGPPPGWKPPEPKGPPPKRASAVASTSGSRMIAMLKAALGTQLMLQPDSMEDPEAKAKAKAMMSALAKRPPRAPPITSENINDFTFHDSRYHAEIEKGVPHNVAWRNARQRRRAIVHRKQGTKERAIERQRLDLQWHERYDNPESAHGPERIDEDNLNCGVETVVVGKAGGTTVTPFGGRERNDFSQFPQEERMLLNSDPNKKQKDKRVRPMQYRQKRNRARNHARKMARLNREPLVLKENPNWKEEDDNEDFEIDDFSPPDKPRDQHGSGGPDGGFGAAPATVCSFGADGAWEGWQYAELNLDTGAAITAVPADFAKGYPRNEPNGANYKAANGEAIQDQGGVTLSGTDKNGIEIPLDCRVCASPATCWIRRGKALPHRFGATI